MPAVIASLEYEATERGDALAVGLCRVVKSFKFIASLYMCDILPKVSRLSRIFQLSDLDMSELHKHVAMTIDALTLLLTRDGIFLGKLDNDLSSSLSSFDITNGGPETKCRFQTQIRKPFLIRNINERLPDTVIFANFEVLNPLKLPGITEEAAETHYGEVDVQKLGDHYGIGDAPIISSDDVFSEWLDLRLYLILNCSKFTMKDVLNLLAKQDTTSYIFDLP